jgi:RNA polymerase sigma-70 factor, ECF subfamily
MKEPQALKSATDQMLVARCKKKDPAAFDELILRYEKKVIGLCFRHLQQYEEACDLAQEIFVQVFQKIKAFQGRSSFSTWIYRVTLNACYNRSRYLHSKGRGEVYSLEGILEAREAGPDSTTLMRSPDPSPLRQVEAQETGEQVRQALSRLNPEMQKVIELVDIEGFSYDECAKVLKVPVNTVRSRLNRARLMLKKKLSAHRAE